MPALRAVALLGLAALARGMPTGTSVDEVPSNACVKTPVTRTASDSISATPSARRLITRTVAHDAFSGPGARTLVTRIIPNNANHNSSVDVLLTRNNAVDVKTLVTRTAENNAPDATSSGLVRPSILGGITAHDAFGPPVHPRLPRGHSELDEQVYSSKNTSNWAVGPKHEPSQGQQPSLLARALDTIKSKVTIQRRNGPHPFSYETVHVEDTWVTLVNATPYRWKRRYIHQYQLQTWESWPEFIDPGESIPVFLSPVKDSFYHPGDSAAEVEYVLEFTQQPMSFMLKYSAKAKGFVNVTFQDALASLNNARNSTHELGYRNRLGGSGFVLAGMEGDFVTNDPPINWMQAMLPELGKIPLRQIILPMSHHAGLWKVHEAFNFGQASNTQTQTVGLEHQLGDGGIRVLDFRPVWRKSEFREGHGSKVLGQYHGALGATLNEMIDMVNNFNKQYPGELIIFDVHSTDVWNGNRPDFREFDVTDRRRLYKQLMRLEHRLNVTDENEDITKWPLERFIGDKKSVVLIRFDDPWRWRDDGKTFPGGQEGFVTNKNFPSTHYWSETISVDEMVKTQVENFIWHRPSPDRPIHISDWILTQVGINAINPPSSASIMELARHALRTMYQGLWQGTTSEQYPNWVSMDNVQGNQQKSILLAMNHCLVAKRCGALGGKVKNPNRGSFLG